MCHKREKQGIGQVGLESDPRAQREKGPECLARNSLQLH